MVDDRTANKTRARLKSGGLIKTQRPVVLEIRGSLRQTVVTRQVKPAKFDVDLPLGPRQAFPEETARQCEAALAKLRGIDPENA